LLKCGVSVIKAVVAINQYVVIHESSGIHTAHHIASVLIIVTEIREDVRALRRYDVSVFGNDRRASFRLLAIGGSRVRSRKKFGDESASLCLGTFALKTNPLAKVE
jgi:hypothetical protein